MLWNNVSRVCPRENKQVIQLKSLILHKLGTNVGFVKWMFVAKRLGQNILFPSSYGKPLQTLIYAYLISHGLVWYFYDKKGRVKMKSTGNCFTTVSSKEKTFIWTGQFDFHPWLQLEWDVYYFCSVVNSLKWLFNFLQWSKPNKHISNMDSESNQLSSQTAIKCWGVQYFFCAGVLFTKNLAIYAHFMNIHLNTKAVFNSFMLSYQ